MMVRFGRPFSLEHAPIVVFVLANIPQQMLRQILQAGLGPAFPPISAKSRYHHPYLRYEHCL
jgi:hypothetical protein